MMSRNEQKNNNSSIASAVRTAEGFIEITSLELLDEMVGGLINPEAVFCQLSEEDISVSQNIASEGL